MPYAAVDADGHRMPRLATLLSPVLLACLALILPASAAAAPCSNAQVVPTASNIAQVKSATLCLLNAERKRRGLGRLSSERQLTKAAQRFSASMVRARFFGHVSPAGTTLTSRVRRGTSYLRGRVRSWSLGENLAWGSGELASPRRTVRAWMRSSSHRRNILDRRFRHIGVGVVTGSPVRAGGGRAATYTTDFGVRVRR